MQEMQKAHRVMVIVNPISGTRDKRYVEERLCGRLRASGITVDVHLTTGPNDAHEMGRQAAERGYDLVVAVGGDGTVNEVASSLCCTSTALAIIPSGSGNGLARTLQIPQTPDKAIDIILRGNLEKCDYGVVNGHPFFCTFGVGFDAAVARKFATNKRRGKLSYIKDTIAEYLKYQSTTYALSLDGEVKVEEAFVIAVCNISQYGNNVYIAPEASPNDGLLDVTLIRTGNPVDTARAGLGMLAGTFGTNKTIESFRVRRATITRLHPGPVQIDGEPMEMGKRLEIECRAGALNVIVPENRHKFRPFITPVQAFFSDLGEDIRHIIYGK